MHYSFDAHYSRNTSKRPRKAWRWIPGLPAIFLLFHIHKITAPKYWLLTMYMSVHRLSKMRSTFMLAESGVPSIGGTRFLATESPFSESAIVVSLWNIRCVMGKKGLIANFSVAFGAPALSASFASVFMATNTSNRSSARFDKPLFTLHGWRAAPLFARCWISS